MHQSGNDISFLKITLLFDVLQDLTTVSSATFF
jgi:hypothetical protein